MSAGLAGPGEHEGGADVTLIVPYVFSDVLQKMLSSLDVLGSSTYRGL